VLKVSPDGNISRYAGQGPGGSRTFGGMMAPRRRRR
jgi:hypothetical protein